MPSGMIVWPSVTRSKSPKRRAKSQRKKLGSTVSASTKRSSTKRSAKSQRKKLGSTVSDLILMAVSTSTERSGMSMAALMKALKAGGYNVGKNKARILMTIRRLVTNKALIQNKGTGASGSFKLNKRAPAPPKKKPKAEKVKRTSVKESPRMATRSGVKSTRTRVAKKSPLCH